MGDEDWADAEAAWAAAEAEADAIGAASAAAAASASAASAAASTSGSAAGSTMRDSMLSPAAAPAAAATEPKAAAAAAAAASFQITTAGLSSELTSFSDDTASMLSHLGVRGASADALEDNIMAQVQAEAKKLEVEAAKKRRVRERHAAAGGDKKVRREGLTESRERRRREEAQRAEGGGRAGVGTAATASGGEKKTRGGGGLSSEDAIRSKHRDDRLKGLNTETVALKKHMKQLSGDISKLERDSSKKSKLQKAQRLLAARQSKLTAVQSEIKVLTLLGQQMAAPAPMRSGASSASSSTKADLSRVHGAGAADDDNGGETERERMIRMGQITPFQDISGLDLRTVKDPTRMPQAPPVVHQQALRSGALSRSRAASRHGRAEVAARAGKSGREAGFQAQLQANRQAVGSRPKAIPKKKKAAAPQEESGAAAAAARPAKPARVFESGADAAAAAGRAAVAASGGGKRRSTGEKRPRAAAAAPKRQIAGKRPPASKRARREVDLSSDSDDSDADLDPSWYKNGGEPGGASAAGAAAGGGEEEDPDLKLARRLQAEEDASSGRRTGRERRPAAASGGGASGGGYADDGEDLLGNVSADEEEESEQEEDGEDLFSSEDEDEDEEDEEDLSEGEAEDPGSLVDLSADDEDGGGGGRPRKQKRQRKKRSRRGSGASDASGGDSETVDPEKKASWTSLTNAQQDALQATDSDDVVFDGGLKVPGNIYDNLLDYQQVGLKWLWELHNQRAGGIIGDEMGLGKTVQMISLLASLGNSGMLAAPSIVVAPATLLQQWARELATWAPRMPVAVYRNGFGSSVEALDEVLAAVTYVPSGQGEDSDDEYAARTLWCHGVVVTTYDQIRTKLEALLQHSWHYFILDEGHKIRNPDTGITLAVKQFDTPHRIIMSGSPIQNSLTELWSLFDFVLPGKLGTLPVFKEQFELPITIGGYANASTMQVETAYRCSVVLKGLIGPYLLRRLKRDVGTSLPDKTEQVLFCELTQHQRTAYLDFLGTDEMRSTLSGKRKPFAAITELRKICNHPDLLDRLAAHRPEDYGAVERSGKLVVADQILTMWASQGHRALVFSQTRQMLDILELVIQSKENISYRRMDGELPIKQRLAMIDEYNTDDSIFVFLLTTKVGGLGINLTGADRVLLFDPDWNPSTDMQARERAWRLGQTKPVTVYRLLTAGTIEEKMYHRQIFKQMLTDKVLKDPMQKRFFKAGWLQDLFTLGDSGGGMGTGRGGHRKRNREAARGGVTETHSMFSEANIERPEEAAAAGAGADAGAAAGGEDALAGVRVEDMPAAAEGEEEDADASSTSQHKSDNAVVLKQLFDGGSGDGVKGALSHDAIMNEQAVDKVIVRQKAEQIAQAAIAGLKASSSQRNRSSITQPTWTGRSGEAGMPRQQVSRPRPAPVQQQQTFAARNNPRSGRHGGDSGQAELRMGQELARFLKENGGSAPSGSIIAHFQKGVTVANVGSEVRSAREMELFKALLKQIASLDKQTKEWRLK